MSASLTPEQIEGWRRWMIAEHKLQEHMEGAHPSTPFEKPPEGKPHCPKCGDEATYQTPDGAYWDGNAHFWRLESPTDTEICECPRCGRAHRSLGFGKPPGAKEGGEASR